MAYKLSMLITAESEYEKAINRYRERSDETAFRFVSEVADALETLANNPTAYGYYFPPYRRVLLKAFPFKIVFEIAGEKIVIHAVYHTSRNDDELRKRLP